LARAVKGLEGSTSDALQKNLQQVREFAFGKTTGYWVEEMDVEDFPPDDEDFEYRPAGRYVTRTIPGKLKPPLPALQREIQEIQAPLDYLVGLARGTFEDVVVTFDGLDRIIAPERFLSIVHQDFRALRALRVSILATAPISVYGTWRTVAEHFDRVQPLPVIAADPGHDGFLYSVLAKRGAFTLMEPREAESICHFSGGVLRDLITLARDAAEEAYIAGSDRIGGDHVRKVVWQLGNAYLRGLGPEQIKTLRALEATRSFNLQIPSNMELLVTRRVLEYSSTDFRVHPSLLPLIKEPERKSA